MKIFLIVILCIAAGFAIAWPFIEKTLIRNLFAQNAKPLTGEEIKFCEKIVSEGKGLPLGLQDNAEIREMPLPSL
ncbi:hypothetical protein COY52_02775 [Candidatus Desantisbacteria bacterium CG_4_10_14_0_8_um_filter_48_22]|uniref:Uncharacterized protein n=1 Tax=Candidatus Desantisbacteria bacterium CG_4_10_14_0_8_um_filter_48_22 TaxID=1974543 RepID=A0A2M7SDY3_9BACT|nr:MAG: hypothetical protein AUJ67_02230 [Candidatus Desantisbacteria bacterium CG1_02_49_89]PIV57470.1 MAG: hypothetical protein COS16_00300 [Candidatus Desantisbacteria bacterium CG02_land_8_20_14_3_00_49_13]PIZ17747.1 MAG: hypothetical protein COY52_02775 [Candidatus Desantisbacteria bacterium CG_4_10_14_0_8_um_filter_48_22]PJB27893.1 MAG: hypothetical protein CO111_03000 [Candidatus Desantisbacteria bacterium CG_4_9_14_3_um_filter_50_7]